MIYGMKIGDSLRKKNPIIRDDLSKYKNRGQRNGRGPYFPADILFLTGLTHQIRRVLCRAVTHQYAI